MGPVPVLPCRASLKAHYGHTGVRVPVRWAQSLRGSYPALSDDLTQCRPLKANRRFGGISCLHLQQRSVSGTKKRTQGTTERRSPTLRPHRAISVPERGYRQQTAALWVVYPVICRGRQLAECRVTCIGKDQEGSGSSLSHEL
jgi:hypothetical protein